MMHHLLLVPLAVNVVNYCITVWQIFFKDDNRFQQWWTAMGHEAMGALWLTLWLWQGGAE